ncbi:MAG: YitT family protein [Oscillospiraceae bacterium]|nr:YitT family protein [Oscillospiraceae bacterium]
MKNLRVEPKRLIKNLILMFIGSLVYAAGFQYILLPNSVPTGGIGGISMIINKFTGFPIGTLIIILNIPLFILAWKKLGFKFMVSSVMGTILSSVCIDLLSLFPHTLTQDPFLTSIFGGVIYGAGLGIIYRGGATTGGSDIIAKLIRVRYPFMNFGTAMLILDIIIISLYAVIFDKMESAMYALITMFLSSKVIDLVLYGADVAKLCIIISDHGDEVRDFIFQSLDRGVTFLHGSGGYSEKDKKIVMCAIRPQQIVELRASIKCIAPDAFIIITDSREVFGDGFSDIADIK